MSYTSRHLFATLPEMERGVAKIISGDPKGKNFLYTNGKSVIIRDISNPRIADVYTEHAHKVLVAKYAPSGFYIASGDVTGKVKIWDTTQKEHLLKYEYPALSGKVLDIAWTEDSKRLAVVGEGREKFSVVFLWDSGSSVGDLSGHSKVVNSVDIKPTRPYRLVTGSDDNTSTFFEGPPFKFKCMIRNHSQFVNCVRFSPNGNYFATAGADGEIFLHEGKGGELVRSLGGAKAHNGGVYSVCWSPDGSQLISASGDKTVKMWDVEKGSAVTTFTMGTDVLDQQLGCLWQNEHLLSVSLSGHINYLNKENPDKPYRVIEGHTKSIHCLTVHKGDGKPCIYSGSNDGHISCWDSETGVSQSFSGKGHTNQVSSMTINENQELVSCSKDDTLRFTSMTKSEYSDVVKMDSQPQNVSTAEGGLTLVVCIDQVVLLKNKRKVFTLDKLGYEPEVGALHPGGTIAAIGDKEGVVHLYSVTGTSLKAETTELKVQGTVTDLDFSPNGAHLAVLDATKVLTVYNVADNYTMPQQFYGHHAKPVTLSWNPDCEHLATGGMDMNVYIWELADSNKRIKMPDTHRLHHVSCLRWIDRNTLVTTSHDGNVKQWNIAF